MAFIQNILKRNAPISAIFHFSIPNNMWIHKASAAFSSWTLIGFTLVYNFCLCSLHRNCHLSQETLGAELSILNYIGSLKKVTTSRVSEETITVTRSTTCKFLQVPIPPPYICSFVSMKSTSVHGGSSRWLHFELVSFVILVQTSRRMQMCSTFFLFFFISFWKQIMVIVLRITGRDLPFHANRW